MKDFLHRTVSESVSVVGIGGETVEVAATRSRASSGFAAIAIDFDGKRVLDLTTDHLANYQEAARAIATLLQRMADEPCTLPQV